MKKLLIVSLFLLSMIGLMAQGSPYLLQFPLQTASGGFHAEGTIGFKAIETHPNFTTEQWNTFFPDNPLKELYWNWPGEEDLNTNNTVYTGSTGIIAIQMATMNNFSGTVSATFTFIDADGNESEPVSVVKTGEDGQVETTPIAWGGPVGPTPVLQWATVVAPLDGAMDVALDTDLAWAYPEASDEVLAADGFEVWVNGSMVYDGPNLTYAHNLAYETPYTWYVKPYTNTEAKRGMKASRLKEYPEGEVTEWTFTTMDEPLPDGPDAWATVVAPEDEAVEVALDAQLEWSYEGEVAPTGYMLYWNGGDAMDLGDVLTYNPGELDYNSTYTWSIAPYVNSEAKRGMKATRQMLYPGGDMPVWSFTTAAEYVDEEPIVVPGTTVTVQINVEFDGPVPAGFTPPVPGAIPAPIIPLDMGALAGAFNFGATVNAGVPGTYTFTFVTDIFQGAVYVDGEYQFDAAFPGGLVTISIYFDGSKETKEIVITEPTLPVELSSFTAQAHANEYVTLKWVTESESNLHGYNVYRAETENQDQAIRVNPSVVAANNETQTQTYTYTDNEVEATTYYYWLEVSELSNENSFHGPIVVTVEDDPVVPGITETVFRNFGPSPFSESTSTSLRVKEGETATVTIYNLLGQVVSRESFNAGEHNFEFNGRDLNNKKVANGIYFVRMSSPTQSRSFKIVKMK